MTVRVDYFQIGLNEKKCLNCFKHIKHDLEETIQVIAGDHSGYLQSSLIRCGRDVQDVFKCAPDSCFKVTSITTSQGKVFVGTSTGYIRGITRKGKQFFNLELSNSNEPILHLKVSWPKDIFVAGEYIYTHYTLHSDGNITMVDSYISPGKITAMCILESATSRGDEYEIPVLASDDRTLRILKQSKCQFQLETSSIPKCLFTLGINEHCDVDDAKFCGFLYGSTDGKVTMVDMNSDEPRIVWDVPETLITSGGKSNKSSVEVIEMANDGSSEMFIGRADGTIEVWIFASEMTPDGPDKVEFKSSPVMRFTYNCNESITSLVPSYDNLFLIVSTFSGCIFGLSWRSSNTLVGATSNRKRLIEAQKRIESLRLECLELEDKLTLERTRYIATHKEENNESIISTFMIKDSFILTDDAEYLLTLEAEVAMDVIIIQSDVPVMLGDSEKNSAVVSVTETDTQQTLATFRCQSNTTRLEVTIKTIEGQFGSMRVYCVARLSPKTCHMKVYYLTPLSLHKRIHVCPVDEQVPCNTLEIIGDFSLKQAYDWLFHCLPEVPAQIASSTSKSSYEYHFKSTLYSTFVSCIVRKGKLNFKSDSVSSISIIKDFITRDATSKSIPVQVDNDLKVASVIRVLKLLHPVALKLIKLNQLNQLKEAINELSRNELELSQSLAREIDNEFNVETSSKNSVDNSNDLVILTSQTLDINRINGLVTDLFIDYCKLRGILLKDAKGKSIQLPGVLEKALTTGDADQFVSAMFSHWVVDLTQ